MRRFIRQHVTPIAEEYEAAERFPHDLLKEMGRLGYLGIPYPDEYGGSGRDYLSYAIAVEEFSRAWGSLGIIVAAHTTLGTGPLFNFGPEPLKRAWVPRLARGEIIGSYGLTEPQAGSDSGATATSAKRDGDHYVLNGTKAFCTNVTHAACTTLTAVTGRDEKKGKNRISAFFVPRDLPGVAVTKHEDKLGLRASDTSTLILEDARVPESHILGTEGEGFKIFMQTLDNGRISIGAMALGLGQAALDETLRFAHEQMGLFKSMFDEQQTLAAIADMATEIAAARMMVYGAARLKDGGLPHTEEAAMAKFYASEAAMRATDRCLDVLGRGGPIPHDCLASRAFRDVKLCTIGEGTSEVQRLVISRELLRSYAAAHAEEV
jgi:butyryl-CoA dehydrogenase